MNEVKQELLDSQLFTQVEPEWLAQSQGYATLVNKSRGVVAVCATTDPFKGSNKLARMFFDCGETTYYSSGWYNSEEIQKWILPIMRSDRAWKVFTELAVNDRDLTIALDYL